MGASNTVLENKNKNRWDTQPNTPPLFFFQPHGVRSINLFLRTACLLSRPSLRKREKRKKRKDDGGQRYNRSFASRHCVAEHHRQKHERKGRIFAHPPRGHPTDKPATYHCCMRAPTRCPCSSPKQLVMFTDGELVHETLDSVRISIPLYTCFIFVSSFVTVTPQVHLVSQQVHKGNRPFLK